MCQTLGDFPLTGDLKWGTDVPRVAAQEWGVPDAPRWGVKPAQAMGYRPPPAGRGPEPHQALPCVGTLRVPLSVDFAP